MQILGPNQKLTRSESLERWDSGICISSICRGLASTQSIICEPAAFTILRSLLETQSLDFSLDLLVIKFFRMYSKV